ncbi:MAG: DUF4389 domain-containing protein [Deltaproteobacteria bacterium]
MSVELETKPPPRFEPGQLGLRVLLAGVLAWFGITLGSVAGLLYFVLPVIAAGAISSTGGAGYLQDVAPQLRTVLVWFVRCEAYFLLLVDRFPTADETGAVATELRFTGTPTLGSALVRIVTSLPSACVLAVLAIPCVPLWVVMAMFILAGAEMPPALLAYQRGVLRWQLRLFAYHASLVAEYPPWHFHADAPLAQVVMP